MSEITKLAMNGTEYTLTDGSAVAFAKTQTLTDAQMRQACLNIGAARSVDVENEIDRLDEAIAQLGNGSSGGLTDTARILLMTVLKNGVYTSDQSANLAALEEALKTSGGSDTGGDTGGEDSGDTGDTGETVTYTITNNLTNCTNSNSATSITENSAYTAVITAADGYELQSVIATMGGSAVAVTNGVISISAVTGNIVITAVATAVTTETVEENLIPTEIGANYPDITTFEYTPIEANYSNGNSGVLFQPSTVGGGVVYVDVDTSEVSKIKFLMYVFNAANEPYQLLKAVNLSGGHIENPVMVSPSTTPGWSTATASFTMDIPEGCNVMVHCDTSGFAETTTLTNGYAFKREVLAGNIVTAKVVKGA